MLFGLNTSVIIIQWKYNIYNNITFCIMKICALDTSVHFLIISLIILYLIPGYVCFTWLQVTYIYITANHFANHAAVLQIRMCFSFHLRHPLFPINFCCYENQCAGSWNMLYLCYPSQWTASLHPFLSKLHYCFALMTFQMNLHSNCIIMQQYVTYKNECRLDVHWYGSHSSSRV